MKKRFLLLIAAILILCTSCSNSPDATRINDYTKVTVDDLYIESDEKEYIDKLIEVSGVVSGISKFADKQTISLQGFTNGIIVIELTDKDNFDKVNEGETATFQGVLEDNEIYKYAMRSATLVESITTDENNAGSMEETNSISIAEYRKAFAENALAADQKFRNKLFKVTGEVSNITEGDDVIYVTLIEETWLITCGFELDHRDEILELKTGDIVTVKGKSRGNLYTEIGDDLGKCTFIYDASTDANTSGESGTSYKDIGAGKTNPGSVNSMEEAQEIVEAWMLDHPMGTMAGVSTGAAVNDVDSISAEYFVLELWKSPREFAGLVYIRKSDGYITFKQFDSDVEISLDEWYNGTFGEADMVAGNGAKSIVEGEILYKGFPVTQFFNSTIDDAVNALGAPTYEGYYEGPAYVFNDEISFRFDDITREIAFIETRIPHVLEVNGIALGKYREEIINALGTPTHEITFYDEMENKNVYKMEYSLNEYGIVLSIQMPHPDGKVKLVVIRQDYQSDEEYQESSNNIDPSSPLTTADGNTLSVGSLVYAKQNVFGVSVNYVRGYVTAINDAGSVSVQWDTLLENRLWAYDECAILSDSSSPSGYSYYSSASGKQIPLAGVKFNLSANELYSKIP